MSGPDPQAPPPHVPVLLAPLLAAAAPVHGIWIDATLGAGGYARGLLEAGAERLVGVDRDPTALAMAAEWAAPYGARVVLARTTFDRLDVVADGPVQGVALDLGVSSMQLDRAERGFSFRGEGPLDMRMGDAGPTAADLIANAGEDTLADILFHYGEERASRRIARAILDAYHADRLRTTRDLAAVVERCLPRPKPGASHPATRSFQAIRIAVNDEFGQLVAGLEAAERALAPGGLLAVVAFHSLEDRVVKRFMQVRAGRGGRGSRHAPDAPDPAAPRFDKPAPAIAADADELAANPRARSARLRLARRTDAPAGAVDRAALGLPQFDIARLNLANRGATG